MIYDVSGQVKVAAHCIPDPPQTENSMHTKSIPNKGFAEFDARIHTLGIGLSRSRAPRTRNCTCSTYGVITSINQRLHTVCRQLEGRRRRCHATDRTRKSLEEAANVISTTALPVEGTRTPSSFVVAK